MDLYLMQHGVAVPEAEDPERPLTKEGRAAVERVARRAAAAGVRADLCMHSGKLRAEQTAEILAEALEIPIVDARAGMSPGDPAGPLAEWLIREAGEPGEGSIAFVGHLPFLDRLTSLLVAGDEAAGVLAFRNAALVKLVPRSGADGYSVEWVLPPALA